MDSELSETSTSASISVASIGRFDLEEMVMARALVMSALGPETGLKAIFGSVRHCCAVYLANKLPRYYRLSCSSCGRAGRSRSSAPLSFNPVMKGLLQVHVRVHLLMPASRRPSGQVWACPEPRSAVGASKSRNLDLA